MLDALIFIIFIHFILLHHTTKTWQDQRFRNIASTDSTVKVWATFSKFLQQLLIRGSEQVCCKDKLDRPEKPPKDATSARISVFKVETKDSDVKNTVVERLTWVEWAGRGVILQSKALPGITVTVSWTSGISSVSCPSQLCSCTHTGPRQTQTRVTTAHSTYSPCANGRCTWLHLTQIQHAFKQQCMSLQDMMD